MRKYAIYSNSGEFWGTMEVNTTDKDEIENAILEEIKNSNKNLNPMYHIARKNFMNIAEIELEKFIKENSGIWDLTDAKEFLIYHKDDILEILKRL